MKFHIKKPVLWAVFLLFLGTFAGIAQSVKPETVRFPSKDGLLIDALVYETGKDAPVILLCHQARFNKHEYDDIAPQLNAMGFNCIAIDQRSGGDLRGFKNETHERAVKAGKPTGYLDAEQDIRAAVDYTFKRYGKPVILWGSSYSSTLAWYIAANNPKVAAVVAFSPGNYFAGKKGSLVSLLENFDKPFFITSSAKETAGIKKLLELHTLKPGQVHFIPKGEGWHGSKALWKGQKGGAEYWDALIPFLKGLKQ